MCVCLCASQTVPYFNVVLCTCSVLKVQKYETDHEQFCDWLNDKKHEIEDFGPIPVTPEEVEKELKKVQVRMLLFLLLCLLLFLLLF